MQQVQEIFVLDADDERNQAYRRKKWLRSAEFYRWLQEDELPGL